MALLAFVRSSADLDYDTEAEFRKTLKDYIETNKVNFYRIKNMNFTRNFYFIYSKKKALSPLENKFLNSIFEYFNICKKEID